MAKSENIIRILELPPGAFNKHRPVSDLLRTHAENLAAAVIRMIDSERLAIDTEERASAFIKKYSAFLRHQPGYKKPAPSPNGAGKRAAPAAPSPQNRAVKPKNGSVKKESSLSGKISIKTIKKAPRSSKR